ncbi:DNA-binding protein [Bifidobacterium dentium]|uniref:DNA-binding protein n=1 Tax=Bifidobacterium dentium TaxID=1689 RepID=UPI001FD80827|nr:DNA-binding protein [Bifidobacterium dentium]
MTNFVTASRGDELSFRIDDSVESKFFHTIVTLVSLGMPEAAALCGLTEKTIRQAVRRGDLIACYAYTSTVRIRQRGFG